MRGEVVEGLILFLFLEFLDEKQQHNENEWPSAPLGRHERLAGRSRGHHSFPSNRCPSEADGWCPSEVDGWCPSEVEGQLSKYNSINYLRHLSPLAVIKES
jgi:hypothetical protein